MVNQPEGYGTPLNGIDQLREAIKRREQSLPPIVEPRSFLAKPFRQIEVGRLASPPDIDLLRFLPTLGDEVGLVLQRPIWFVIKASSMGIPSYLMPNQSDVLLHSHPIDEDEEANDGSIPSIRDFINCSPTATNLIASHRGITVYSRVEGDIRRDFEREVWSNRFGRGTMDEYLRFLEEKGASHEVVNWEDLPDRFDEFFK